MKDKFVNLDCKNLTCLYKNKYKSAKQLTMRADSKTV